MWRDCLVGEEFPFKVIKMCPDQVGVMVTGHGECTKCYRIVYINMFVFNLNSLRI